MNMNDEHTVVPETAGKMTDFEIEIEGEWVSVNGELNAHEIPMACPTCGGFDGESVVYFLATASICTRACAVYNSRYVMKNSPIK